MTTKSRYVRVLLPVAMSNDLDDAREIYRVICGRKPSRQNLIRQYIAAGLDREMMAGPVDNTVPASAAVGASRLGQNQTRAAAHWRPLRGALR